MSENLAILVGGVEYDNLSNLDCCRHDIEVVRDLLKATGRFSSIKSLLNKNSADLKDSIRNSLENISSANEVFFYYTGHGFLNDGEFYFCAKDFNSNFPNKSGLSNTDLHTLIRGIKSETVIKIIDSCASGVNLIKSDIHPLKREEKFNNFIQIASCLDSQSSLTGTPLSEFTEAFIKAILSKESGQVYYHDIIANLRDYFLDNPYQTPHFVSQSTGREIFANDGSVFNVFRNKMEMDNQNIESAIFEPPGEEEIKESILGKLKQLDEKFANKEKAQSFIDNFQTSLESAINLDSFLPTFFDLEKSTSDDYKYIENPKPICRILQNQTRYDNFVEANYEKIRLRRPLAMEAVLGPEYETTYDLTLNCSLSRVVFQIDLIPKFKSIKKMSEVILFAPSLDKCFIFDAIKLHPLMDWEEFQEEFENSNWRWYQLEWNKSPKLIIDNCLNTLITNAKKHLQKVSRIKFLTPD